MALEAPVKDCQLWISSFTATTRGASVSDTDVPPKASDFTEEAVQLPDCLFNFLSGC